MKQTLAILFVLICLFSFSQEGPPKEYFPLVEKGLALYNAKDYKGSTEAYSKAFKVNGGKALLDDRYNAACSWALYGKIDSAFYHLNRLVTKGKVTDYRRFKNDPDLEILHKDKRWQPLMDSILHNKDIAEAGFNKPLVRILDTILEEDQKYRMEFDAIENDAMKSNEQKDKERTELAHKMDIADGKNLKKVMAILDKYGWLGPEEIGQEGNSALFLVIQHSRLDIQEKYLPMMREAVKNKKAEPSALALLEDRVLIGQGKKQIYGSQLTTDANGKSRFSPIEDEANVNKRRAEVGLEPIEEYAKHFGITYKYDPNKIEEDPIRFTCNQVIIFLIAGYFFIVIILFFVMRTKLFLSAWFWFFSVLFALNSLSQINDIKNGLPYEPAKWLLFGSTDVITTILLSLLLTSLVSMIIKRKHIIIEVMSIGIITFLSMYSLNAFIYKLFYPDNGMRFYLNIIGVLIPIGIFLVIKAILWLIQRKKTVKAGL
jgi:hypothetical protein